MTTHPRSLLCERSLHPRSPTPRRINITHPWRPRAQSQAHTGSTDSACQAAGCSHGNRTGGQAERRQAGGRPHAISEGWGASTARGQAAHTGSAWLLTSPAGPLTTRTVFPQEAGGVLARVESRRQGAVGTEPGLQEEVLERTPMEGC